jgi:Trehalose receptor
MKLRTAKVGPMKEQNLRLADDEDFENPSFHQSVGPVLAYGQFFAILPVDGVLAKDEDQLRFRWKSIKTIYSLLFLFCGTVESCMGTRRLLRLGFNIGFAEGLLFFVTAMIRSYLLFGLARHWKEFIAFWRKCEEAFLHPPYSIRGWSLSSKTRVAFVVLTVIAAGEDKFASFLKRKTSHLFLSRAPFLLGNSDYRQQFAAALLHAEVGNLLGEFSGPLPASPELSLSVLTAVASALRGKSEFKFLFSTKILKNVSGG